MNRDLLKQELERDEGRRLKPYCDSVGKLTTGVGRCLDTNPLIPEEIAHIGHDCRTLSITEEQAEYLLDNDIDKVITQLDENLSWWRSLDDVRQRVLVNMAFNMGVHTLLTFKNTLAYIQSAKYGEASVGMIASKWAQQVGQRAHRLANMMRDGRA